METHLGGFDKKGIVDKLPTGCTNMNVQTLSQWALLLLSFQQANQQSKTNNQTKSNRVPPFPNNSTLPPTTLYPLCLSLYLNGLTINITSTVCKNISYPSHGQALK